MSHSVKMPALGESVTEGTVTRWLHSEGDQVTEDEPLLEVSTDKVDTEVPAPYSGVLERILVQEDETVEIGAELAIIGDGSGSSDSGSDAGEAQGQAADSDENQPEPEPEPEAAPEAEQPSEAPSTETEQPAQAPQAGDQSNGGDHSGDAAGEDGGDGGDDDLAPSGSEVTMPAMGESVTEGTVTRWLKRVGDEVAEDEPLLEISTDKVDTEVPSPVGGTLLKILAAEDETVEVGAPLAIIGKAGAQAAPTPQKSAEQEPAADRPPAEPETKPESGSRPEREPEPAADTTPETQPEREQQAAEAPEQRQPERKSEPESEPEPEQARQEPASAAATQAAPPAPREPAWQPPAQQRAGVYVTPVVRKLAADSGVDLSTVTGSGVGGRIRREDVLAAAEQQRAAAEATAAPAPSTAASGGPRASGASTVRPTAEASALIGTTQATPRIRQSIARNMLSAVTTSAQLTTVIEVDVTRVASLRQRAKAAFEAREGVKLSFLPFFVKAAVEAAKAYPIINSSLSEDLKQITYHPTVNMGIAVDTPRGLIVPVIQHADDLNIGGIARRIADLAERTRSSNIGPDELSGGTLTLTNTGSVGALFDTAIFVPPQSAIVVAGAVVKRPVVVTDSDGNDVIAVRSMAYVALSYDHRTIDGADAARYLGAIKRRLEGGEFEADLGL